MKTRFSFLWMLTLVVCLFMLAACFPATPTLEAVTNTLESGAPVAFESPYPPPPTDTPEPPPYVAPATATPAPTRTPTATPYSVVNLPPLPTYPPPGPFSEMRILFYNRLSPGLRTIKLDSTSESTWNLPQEHLELISNNVRPSPDGTKVLYYLFSSRDVEHSSIWLINPDGSGMNSLVESDLNTPWYPSSATWSPDGTQIAYLRKFWVEGDLSTRELWVIDTDGSNAHMVVNDENLVDASINPFWALNGYIYLANKQNKLYALNPWDGTLYKLMDEVDPLDLRFSLAPDGQHALNWGTVTSQKLQSAMLVDAELPGEFGGWSSSGTQVVYGNEQGLWLFDLETGVERLLLPGDTTYTTQIHGFSPDGRYVAYQTDAGLFVINIENINAQPWLVITDPLDGNGTRTLFFISWIPIN